MVDNGRIVREKYAEAIEKIEGVRVDDPEDFHLLALRRAQLEFGVGCWVCRVRHWYIRRTVELSRWWVRFCTVHRWPAIWSMVLVLVPFSKLLSWSGKAFNRLVPCTTGCENKNRRDNEKGGA